jgi:hypothetical protein
MKAVHAPKPDSFRVWCENNGKRWQGARDFAEFERNARQYEAYLKTAEANAAVTGEVGA